MILLLHNFKPQPIIVLRLIEPRSYLPFHKRSQGQGFTLPFSTFASDAGITAEPSLLSTVIALISTVHVIPSYRHRTYRLLHIMKVLRLGGERD